MAQNKQLECVQGLMVLLASLANGLDDIFGRGAGSVTYRAGRAVGLKTPVKYREPDDLQKALNHVWDAMNDIGILWAFEPYKKQNQPELITVQAEGQRKIQLVFRHCMVRSSLFRYGYPQRLALCLMNHGLFCGLVEQIYGARATLDIVHAGENACLKILTVDK